jgi:hypothetical protein
LRARPEPTQWEHLSDASFLNKLLVFPPNVRLDRQVIASYKHSSLFVLIDSDEGKKFYYIATSSMVTKKAFQFLESKGELKPGAVFEGREMSQFLVKRLQVSRLKNSLPSLTLQWKKARAFVTDSFLSEKNLSQV